ncbi:MAG TPA: hypothetical protein VKT77_23605, partial [Chthonomonadaceae bacterium]|nr:hypothetical protein [Chthonomonadaceae bacterium]
MRAAHAIAAAGLLIVCGAARPEPCRASQQAKTPAQEAKPDPAASKDDAPVWTADLSKAAIP